MTKVQNPVIGRASGQAGGMVFSKLYGQNIMRARPHSVSNPNTIAQQAQRSFIKELGEWSSQLGTDALMTLFPIKPTERSRFSEFQKQVALGRTVDGAVGSVDWDNVPIIGNGPLQGLADVEFNPGGESITVTWDSSNVFGIDPESAVAVFAVVNTAKKEIIVLVTEVTLDVETASIDYIGTWDDQDEYVVFMKSKAGTELQATVRAVPAS